MIGVYKITNKLNNKCYIGISTDIESRWTYHKKESNWYNKKEYNKKLYRSFRKNGLKPFTFEVLEECLPEELSDKEKYYVALFNSYHDGYNGTAGGEDNQGESHPGHKLDKEDIIDIRTRYGNLERKNEVYQLYKDRIGESGFHKIWNGNTWKGIMKEVYTDDNKTFHKHDTSNKGTKNGRSKLTENDVRNIRLRRKNGEILSNVYSDYSDKITYGSFTNVWTYQNWKNIIV